MKQSRLIKILFILTGVLVILLLSAQACMMIIIWSATENPCGLYKSIILENTPHAEKLISQGMFDKPCGGIFPIHAASEKANQHILKLLLNKGEDPNRLDEAESKTPIMWLVAGSGLTNKRSIECFELLVEKGANINLKSPDTGRSPLHMSVDYKDFITTKGLVERGIEIDAQDKQGKTPLHFAVEDNNEMLVELLLDSGANNSLLDNNNETPLDIAKRMDFPEIQKLLKEQSDIK
ncbi:ankyrin repeat domain-containing protein [Gimesia aquarii]|uniref:Ankyrin repeats (3 copies) n=1 Tax=Gimesia aquarii TaxID=2527964 RepID=A0A517X1P1_9PLAN|nr:ankyrin repeat domain-containing protein [Gimesia aquarii]QDU11426.1 Ankyrin repeats (3 copies) [Gimesia aquarii]